MDYRYESQQLLTIVDRGTAEQLFMFLQGFHRKPFQTLTDVLNYNGVIDDQIDFIDCTGTKYDVTPLIIAAGKGSYEKAKILLVHGANPNKQCTTGDTALNLAAHRQKYHIVDLLLQYCANPNLYNRSGKTALHRAIVSYTVNNTERIRAFLNAGADPNLEDRNQRVPLAEAVIANKPEFVDILLSHDQTLVHRAYRAAVIATYLGYDKCLKTLLNHGMNPNIIDQTNTTLLQIAVRSLQLPIVRLLITNGANQHFANNRGETALSVAKFLPADQQQNFIDALTENMYPLLRNRPNWTLDSDEFRSRTAENSSVQNLLDIGNGTYWCCTESKNAWAVFDLKHSCSINGVRIIGCQNQSSPKNGHFDVSNAFNGPWLKIKDFTCLLSQGNTNDFFFPALKTRFIRIFILDNYGGDDIRIQSIAFFGIDTRLVDLLREYGLENSLYTLLANGINDQETLDENRDEILNSSDNYLHVNDHFQFIHLTESLKPPRLTFLEWLKSPQTTVIAGEKFQTFSVIADEGVTDRVKLEEKQNSLRINTAVMRDLEPIQGRSLVDFSDYIIKSPGRYKIRIVSVEYPDIHTSWQEIVVVIRRSKTYENDDSDENYHNDQNDGRSDLPSKSAHRTLSTTRKPLSSISPTTNTNNQEQQDADGSSTSRPKCITPTKYRLKQKYAEKLGEEESNARSKNQPHVSSTRNNEFPYQTSKYEGKTKRKTPPSSEHPSYDRLEKSITRSNDVKHPPPRPIEDPDLNDPSPSRKSTGLSGRNQPVSANQRTNSKIYNGNQPRSPLPQPRDSDSDKPPISSLHTGHHTPSQKSKKTSAETSPEPSFYRARKISNSSNTHKSPSQSPPAKPVAKVNQDYTKPPFNRIQITSGDIDLTRISFSDSSDTDVPKHPGRRMKFKGTIQGSAVQKRAEDQMKEILGKRNRDDTLSSITKSAGQNSTNVISQQGGDIPIDSKQYLKNGSSTTAIQPFAKPTEDDVNRQTRTSDNSRSSTVSEREKRIIKQPSASTSPHEPSGFKPLAPSTINTMDVDQSDSEGPDYDTHLSKINGTSAYGNGSLGLKKVPSRSRTSSTSSSPSITTEKNETYDFGDPKANSFSDDSDIESNHVITGQSTQNRPGTNSNTKSNNNLASSATNPGSHHRTGSSKSPTFHQVTNAGTTTNNSVSGAKPSQLPNKSTIAGSSDASDNDSKPFRSGSPTSPSNLYETPRSHPIKKFNNGSNQSTTSRGSIRSENYDSNDDNDTVKPAPSNKPTQRKSDTHPAQTGKDSDSDSLADSDIDPPTKPSTTSRMNKIKDDNDRNTNTNAPDTSVQKKSNNYPSDDDDKSDDDSHVINYQKKPSNIDNRMKKNTSDSDGDSNKNNGRQNVDKGVSGIVSRISLDPEADPGKKPLEITVRTTTEGSHLYTSGIIPPRPHSTPTTDITEEITERESVDKPHTFRSTSSLYRRNLRDKIERNEEDFDTIMQQSRLSKTGSVPALNYPNRDIQSIFSKRSIGVMCDCVNTNDFQNGTQTSGSPQHKKYYDGKSVSQSRPDSNHNSHSIKKDNNQDHLNNYQPHPQQCPQPPITPKDAQRTSFSRDPSDDRTPIRTPPSTSSKPFYRSKEIKKPRSTTSTETDTTLDSKKSHQSTQSDSKSTRDSATTTDSESNQHSNHHRPDNKTVKSDDLPSSQKYYKLRPISTSSHTDNYESKPSSPIKVSSHKKTYDSNGYKKITPIPIKNNSFNDDKSSDEQSLPSRKKSTLVNRLESESDDGLIEELSDHSTPRPTPAIHREERPLSYAEQRQTPPLTKAPSFLNIGTENFIRQSPTNEFATPFEITRTYEPNRSFTIHNSVPSEHGNSGSKNRRVLLLPVLNSSRTYVFEKKPVSDKNAQQSRSNGNLHLTSPPLSSSSFQGIDRAHDQSVHDIDEDGSIGEHLGSDIV